MRKTSTRVTKILEAQATVDRWLSTLVPMTIEDPRFDGCLVAYEAAIANRRICERSR